MFLCRPHQSIWCFWLFMLCSLREFISPLVKVTLCLVFLFPCALCWPDASIWRAPIRNERFLGPHGGWLVSLGVSCMLDSHFCGHGWRISTICWRHPRFFIVIQISKRCSSHRFVASAAKVLPVARGKWRRALPGLGRAKVFKKLINPAFAYFVLFLGLTKKKIKRPFREYVVLNIFSRILKQKMTLVEMMHAS